jgi:hypothetical protein
MRKFFLTISLLSLIFLSNLVFAQVTQTEATGSYSGVFFAHESSESWWQKIGLTSGNHKIIKDDFITTLTLMYPGRTFGIGIEAPYIRRTISLSNATGQILQYDLNGWGNPRIVAKYQFGIYHKFQFMGKERLFKAVVSLIGKFKLPTNTRRISSDRQPGLSPTLLKLGNKSKDLTLGFVFHTDTERYFRIHGHVTTTFSVSHKDFAPGTRFHYSFLFILARMGIQEKFYPFIGFKGYIKGADKLNNQNLENSQGTTMFITPGFRSIWWYLNSSKMFIMLEAALQYRVLDSTGSRSNTRMGVYMGTRLYFR